jgi:hypothetical protein
MRRCARFAIHGMSFPAQTGGACGTSQHAGGLEFGSAAVARELNHVLALRVALQPRLHASSAPSLLHAIAGRFTTRGDGAKAADVEAAPGVAGMQWSAVPSPRRIAPLAWLRERDVSFRSGPKKRGAPDQCPSGSENRPSARHPWGDPLARPQHWGLCQSRPYANSTHSSGLMISSLRQRANSRRHSFRESAVSGPRVRS